MQQPSPLLRGSSSSLNIIHARRTQNQQPPSLQSRNTFSIVCQLQATAPTFAEQGVAERLYTFVLRQKVLGLRGGWRAKEEQGPLHAVFRWHVQVALQQAVCTRVGERGHREEGKSMFVSCPWEPAPIFCMQPWTRQNGYGQDRVPAWRGARGALPQPPPNRGSASQWCTQKVRRGVKME